MAKYFPSLIAQPAYWLARHARTGWSVMTWIAMIGRPPTSAGSTSTSASPAMQIRASIRPAWSPPRAAMPQSM